MYCGNCGNPLKNGDKYCEKCGSPVSTDYNMNTPQIQNNQKAEDQTTANILILIAFILFFPVSFLSNSIGIYGLNGISYLVGLTLLIYTRVKYPKNIFAKVLMWLVIIFTIIFIIFVFITFISCSIVARDCGSLG